MPENPSKASGLSAWIGRIRDEDLPIFGATAHEIGQVTESDRSSVVSLAQVILRDAGMTAKVLKLANSAYFNPLGHGISTISRAIVLLGFDLVRDIALSVALIDALLQGGVRERVVQDMARSFHAAVQARAAALRRGDGSPEEVFIAALLFRLGDMAFWCFSGETGERLHEALKRPGAVPEEVQQEVLGFRLRQLTAGLAREWRLNALLQSVAQGEPRPRTREHGVMIGHRLAAAAEEGWESPQARAALQEFAAFVGLPPEEIAEDVGRNAAEAAQIAASYGAAEAARLIPLPKDAEPAARVEEQVEYLEPDPLLQLRILRELSALIAGRPNINELLEMVLEGIYRGIGTDRTLFALLAPNRASLKAKYALGPGSATLAEGFHFPLKPGQADLLAQVIEKGRSYLVPRQTAQPGQGATPSVPAVLRELTGGCGFMVAPIVVNGTAIGLFYADRGPSGGTLGEEDYEAFLHFVQQAGMGVGHIAGRG